MQEQENPDPGRAGIRAQLIAGICSDDIER